MKITRLSVFAFPVPFKVVFRHASASRGRAENLIVAAHGDNGDVGYGEGCPRHYVTGETVPGGLAFIRAHADSFVAEVHDLKSLRAWMLAHRDAIDRNPAAFCAMEIATLDLFGRAGRQSVEPLLSLPPLHGSFRYSAVLGDAPYSAYRWQLHRYRRRGFSDFKVKLSGHPARDRRKMRALAGTASSIRLDANNLWASVDDCIDHLAGLPGQPFAIEEPLRVGDLDGFRTVGEASAMRVILDESLLRAEQLESLPDPERWIVNLRVSKMGGILRSIRRRETRCQPGHRHDRRLPGRGNQHPRPGRVARHAFPGPQPRRRGRRLRHMAAATRSDLTLPDVWRRRSTGGRCRLRQPRSWTRRLLRGTDSPGACVNRRFALAILILGVAFLARVAGQFIQVVAPVELLPPLEMWQGSNLPYPALFAAQIGILLMIGWVYARMTAGRSVMPPRFAVAVIGLGAIYFSVMAVRLVLGLTTMADVKWFASPIPATFHLVLATIVMVIGTYARTVAPTRGGDTR